MMGTWNGEKEFISHSFFQEIYISLKEYGEFYELDSCGDYYLAQND